LTYLAEHSGEGCFVVVVDDDDDDDDDDWVTK
jgi:hypothetical protein